MVTRNTTERPEAVEVGAIKLAGLDKDDIFVEAKTLLDESCVYDEMTNTENSNGNAYKRII